MLSLNISTSLDSDNVDSDSDENVDDNTSVSVQRPLLCTVKVNKEARVACKSYLEYKRLAEKWTACVKKPEKNIEITVAVLCSS
ncbi:unnamed protein product [Parnassius apollo]|uniref:(apollo) hypothetical protein n=1 Tax=Parnassius apollo TaxID=110799 RepID=A0A8S3WYW7_PARAO|nr:unnamed protein product [Parnassius apollo]